MRRIFHDSQQATTNCDMTNCEMMNKMIFAFSVVVAGLPAASAFAQGEDRSEALKHGWVFNYNEAQRQARKTNRPLMVVFRCVP